MLVFERSPIRLTSPEYPRAKVLLAYTGGTIGMVRSPSGSFVPFSLSAIKGRMPELDLLGVEVDMYSLEEPIDSSDATPTFWAVVADLIAKHYYDYDGFVVLHGTDTMAYTASALSFMFEELAKPVVLTGAQLPLGVPRNDARANLLSAIEIAADGEVPEVCIYFNGLLLRGNRSKKVESFGFSAFESRNFPPLAKAGTSIAYHRSLIRPKSGLPFCHRTAMDESVGVLKVFPGLSRRYLEGFLGMDGLRGVVVESFGSGNLPSSQWFLEALATASAKGMVIVNVTQCLAGRVSHGDYANSSKLDDAGVWSGGDMTTEAALTKLMYLLANHLEVSLISKNLRGEMS